jgi:hypothetical protein
LGKKARNAESVNANYKIHDEKHTVIGYQKAEGRRFVEALCLHRDYGVTSRRDAEDGGRKPVALR